MKKTFILILIAFILLGKTTLSAAQTISSKDSLVLVDIYDSTDGPHWYSQGNWKTAQPVSAWKGVTVTNGKITGLDIDSNHVAGHIPESIGNLVDLQTLYLFSNYITGSLPNSIGNLVNLQQLDITFNGFSGPIPVSFGRLKSLVNFYGYSNLISGSLPDSIGELTNLKSFVMGYNKLSGVIPPSIGNLKHIQNLQLQHNLLSGSIPPELSQCTELFLLALSENNLTGSIPSSLGNIVPLIQLYLNNNQLSDSIPSSLGSIAKKMDLHLEYNQLSGTIPASLSNLDASGTNISLNNNHLSSPLPASLAGLKSAWYLFLQNNNLTFDGLEPVVVATQTNGETIFYYVPQASVPVVYSKNSSILSVSVGGTPSNNTYSWYKDGMLITTKTGDSTLAISEPGLYNVMVTNSVATKLTLYSDTFLLAADTAILPAKPAVEYANKEVTGGDGWTNYYFNNNTPADITDDVLLLSLYKNGQNIGTLGDGTFGVKLEATAGAGSNTGIQLTNPLITNESGYWVMNRYWQVTATHQPTTNVGVRFYYNQQDVTDINGSYPSHNLTDEQLIFYKESGGNPDPTTNLAGATKIISLLPGLEATDSTWIYHALTDSTRYAEFSVVSFSGGGGGGTGNGQVLPVILINFTATAGNGQNLLHWTTKQEINTSYFEIERSTDGILFSSIGKVTAKGSNNTSAIYSFADAQPINGINYYRLHTINKDGTSGYSSVINLHTVLNIVMVVYPNPVHDQLHLRFNSEQANKVTIEIINNEGKRVTAEQMALAQGLSTKTIYITALSKGTYFLRCNDSQRTTVCKFIKAD